MLTADGRTTVAKKRGRPQSERNDQSVKVDRSVVGKAKAVATHRGITVAELISEMLRAPIDKAYAQMLRELDAPER